MQNNPKFDTSWEGYVIKEVLSALQPDDAWHWDTYQGAEIGLLLRKGLTIKRIGRKGLEYQKLIDNET